MIQSSFSLSGSVGFDRSFASVVAKLATYGGLPFLLPVPPLAPSQVKQYNIGNVGMMHTGELGLAN